MKGMIFLAKIYIDQGHNPQNPNAGAEGNGYREQDIVFRIGRSLADLLSQDQRFDVKLSRPTQSTQLGQSNATSLRARVEDANSWGANYFISLHTNASAIPSANGTEGYAYSRESQGFILGEYILINISRVTGLKNRGMKTRPTLYVLKRTAMPSVLLELGFISNAYEADLMANQPYLFALGIYNGMLEYFGFS